MHQHIHHHTKPERKILPAILGLIALSIFTISSISQNPDFQTATIQEIKEETTETNDFFNTTTQKVQLQGDDQTTNFSISGTEDSIEQQKLFAGQKVIIQKDPSTGLSNIIDRYRITGLISLLILFAVTTYVFTNKEILYSFLSLGITVCILLIMINQILNGQPPLITTLIGCGLIGTVSIYLAHGFNQDTHISTMSILSTLVITLIISTIFTKFSVLIGTGSEASFYLANNPDIQLNLQNLLLASIMVGTLGVLDDITTSQVATIHELHHTNSKLSVKQLYHKGLNVGKTHITSLINTLVLAYAGSSLPLLILLFTDPTIPSWVTLNQEFFAEEIVRTLIGSISLVIAVPISTYLAAKKYGKQK